MGMGQRFSGSLFGDADPLAPNPSNSSSSDSDSNSDEGEEGSGDDEGEEGSGDDGSEKETLPPGVSFCVLHMFHMSLFFLALSCRTDTDPWHNRQSRFSREGECRRGTLRKVLPQ